MLEISSLTLRVDGSDWLREISATFPLGRMTTLLGRTGAGKTSLMRAIAGLEQPQSGGITFRGEDLCARPAWKRPLAMVTQQFINYPHLSVLDNVAFPLRRQGIALPEARARAERMLAKVGLAAFTARKPGALSGGQQQRVAIARALVRQAPILLLDEPFVNLDYKLREGLREELAELLRDSPETTVLYATTDPREALQMGAEVALLSEGQLLQMGQPREVYDHPSSLCAAQVVSDPPLNVMRLDPNSGKISGLHDMALALPADLPTGTHTLGLRADAIRAGGPLQAQVMLSEMSGSETVTHLKLGDLALVMWERTVITRPPHSPLAISLDLDQALAFDGAGHHLTQEAPHHG